MKTSKFKMPLLAVLVALGLIVTQSAFKPKLVGQTYYYNTAVSPAVWQNAGTLHEDSNGDDGYDENSYRCEDNIEQNCTAQFESTSPTLPASSTPLPGSLKAGDFAIN
ncbi:DUF6520 family protein [Pedobacter sp. 22163]|uniref:DUF6520 family protein n=1 Tax=Pedobacter sp. 22163 TaxID=3453883 RepID=UPI003F82A944